jgi:NAD(P)-dependent dehydrogenase (short-subunit alcohol dehydrogenase family)
MSLLAGKSILITGGASGIGLATAQLAAREGARVAIGDRDASSGKQAVDLILESGGEAVFVPMDVTDDAQVVAAIAACVAKFGRLDGAFNNAGVSANPGGGPLKAADVTDEAWQNVLEVNLSGVWRCMRGEIRHMVARKARGSIVNSASVAGLVGLKGHAAYAATKHGVVGLTRSAAADYASSGIRINAVCPGFVATPLTKPLFERSPGKGLEGVPLKRLGTPEELAEIVVWLMSDRASFVTGAAMAADGGYTSI